MKITNVLLKELIENMIREYRENSRFSESNLEQLLMFGDISEQSICQLINKFHFINTQIADNGGFPVLKQVYSMI